MSVAPYAVYRVHFQKGAVINRKAKKKNCLVPLVFLLYLLPLLYTACADHGNHSISHCSLGAGDLKSRKRFISRMLNQFYLKFVFLQASLRSLKKEKLEVVQLT